MSQPFPSWTACRLGLFLYMLLLMWTTAHISVTRASPSLRAAVCHCLQTGLFMLSATPQDASLSRFSFHSPRGFLSIHTPQRRALRWQTNRLRLRQSRGLPSLVSTTATVPWKDGKCVCSLLLAHYLVGGIDQIVSFRSMSQTPDYSPSNWIQHLNPP